MQPYPSLPFNNKSTENTIVVVGAGIAGIELTYQLLTLLQHRYHVILLERNPDILQGTTQASTGRLTFGLHAADKSFLEMCAEAYRYNQRLVQSAVKDREQTLYIQFAHHNSKYNEPLSAKEITERTSSATYNSEYIKSQQIKDINPSRYIEAAVYNRICSDVKQAQALGTSEKQENNVLTNVLPKRKQSSKGKITNPIKRIQCVFGEQHVNITKYRELMKKLLGPYEESGQLEIHNNVTVSSISRSNQNNSNNSRFTVLASKDPNCQMIWEVCAVFLCAWTNNATLAQGVKQTYAEKASSDYTKEVQVAKRGKASLRISVPNEEIPSFSFMFMTGQFVACSILGEDTKHSGHSWLAITSELVNKHYNTEITTSEEKNQPLELQLRKDIAKTILNDLLIYLKIMINCLSNTLKKELCQYKKEIKNLHTFLVSIDLSILEANEQYKLMVGTVITHHTDKPFLRTPEDPLVTQTVFNLYVVYASKQVLGPKVAFKAVETFAVKNNLSISNDCLFSSPPSSLEECLNTQDSCAWNNRDDEKEELPRSPSSFLDSHFRFPGFPFGADDSNNNVSSPTVVSSRFKKLGFTSKGSTTGKKREKQKRHGKLLKTKTGTKSTRAKNKRHCRLLSKKSLPWGGYGSIEAPPDSTVTSAGTPSTGRGLRHLNSAPTCASNSGASSY